MSKNAFLVLAGFFFIVAAGLHFVMRPMMAGRIDLYQSAPALEVKEVRELGSGRRFRLSAIVAASNRRLYRDLVAYEIEEWSSGTGSSSGSWRTTSYVKPPLLLHGGEGDTLSLQGDYAFLGVPRVYDLGTRKRYRGLVAGDSVGVYGTVAQGPRGLRVLGEVLAQGDASTLVADQQYGMRVTAWVAGCAALAGVLCVVGYLRRRRRTAGI
jgi:hypothetical protein